MSDESDASRVQVPQPPWKRLGVWAVGGLFQVGYAEDSDMLLVLSSQGRGVFDCHDANEKVARDYEEAHDFFDPVRLVGQGLGPHDGQSVRMAGLFARAPIDARTSAGLGRCRISMTAK
jgi:hypothetical protein